MKVQYITALAALLVAQTISAAPAPLLEKITKPGFVMAEYAINKSCMIQSTGAMSINYALGQLSSKRASVLKLSLTTINAAIDKAAMGTLKTWSSTADTGRVEYYAYQMQADGSFKKYILWQTGEIAPKTNNAPEAKLLRNFIDLNCGDPLLY
jgi:hypothetical protein